MWNNCDKMTNMVENGAQIINPRKQWHSPNEPFGVDLEK